MEGMAGWLLAAALHATIVAPTQAETTMRHQP